MKIVFVGREGFSMVYTRELRISLTTLYLIWSNSTFSILEVGEKWVVRGRLPMLYETPILTWWITMA